METKGDYIRRKCLERLNDNPKLGVLEFQDGIWVGMEYNKALLEKAWKDAERNMRDQFSSSAYKNISFDEWYDKNK